MARTELQKTRLIQEAEEKIGEPIEQYLRREYITNQRGSYGIAKELGITAATIIDWLVKSHIETRSHTQSLKLKKGKKKGRRDAKAEVESRIGESIKRYLTREYVTELRSAKNIAEELGTTPPTITNWLKESNIPRRNQRESLKVLFSMPSKKEMINYIEKGLKQEDVARLYNVTSTTILNWERRLGIRRSPLLTKKSLNEFLEENELARTVSSLVTTTNNVGDVAEILVQLWPDRFPSASQLAKSLPGAVKRIGHSLHPFSMWKARGFYDSDFTVPREVRYALDDLLYSIAIDQYQTKFNQSPVRTINELRRFAVQRNGVKKLAQRVLKYYQGVYDFHIPGHGRLKEAV